MEKKKVNLYVLIGIDENGNDILEKYDPNKHKFDFDFSEGLKELYPKEVLDENLSEEEKEEIKKEEEYYKKLAENEPDWYDPAYESEIIVD